VSTRAGFVVTARIILALPVAAVASEIDHIFLLESKKAGCSRFATRLQFCIALAAWGCVASFLIITLRLLLVLLRHPY